MASVVETEIIKSGEFALPGGTVGNVFDRPIDASTLDHEEFGVSRERLEQVVAGLNHIGERARVEPAQAGKSADVAIEPTRQVPIAKTVPSPDAPRIDQTKGRLREGEGPVKE